jgi:hypothetical protein
MGRSGVVGVLIAAMACVVVACVPGPPDDGGTTTTTAAPARCGEVVEAPLPQGAHEDQVSADGRRLVYVRGNEVHAVELATGADRVVAVLPAERSYRGLRLTRDGTRIGIHTNDAGTEPRRAWIIDVETETETETATELDWSALDWPRWTITHGFSGDLSVFASSHGDLVRIVPTDGSPVRHVDLPETYGIRIDETGSTLVARHQAWRNGSLVGHGLDLGSWGGVTDLSDDGARALVDTDDAVHLWHLDSGHVEPLTLPTGHPVAGYGAVLTEGDVYIGGATVDGVEGVWRIDRTTGEATLMPPILDGVTGTSDDGRVITSTTGQYFRCAGSTSRR